MRSARTPVHEQKSTAEMSNDVSRRKFIGGSIGTGALAALALAGCGSSGSTPASASTSGPAGTTGLGTSERTASAKGDGNLVFAGFGGTFDQQVKDHIFDPFTTKTGVSIKMTPDAPDPIAPIQAQVKTGHPAWDFMSLNSATLAECINLGLVEDIDYSRIPNSQGYLSTEYKNPHAPGLWTFSSNMFWNTSAVTEAPKSWADVWDVQRYPGKRGFLGDDPFKTLAIALLADGVTKDQIFPMDIDRALNSLDKIRDHAVFVDINTLTNQIAQQDIVLGYQNLTRLQVAIKDKIPLAYNWNDYLADISYYGLIKHASHPDSYYQLIDFILSTDIQVEQPSQFGHSPATKPAFDKIPEKQQADMAVSSVTEGGAVFTSISGWAKQGTEATKRFNSWLQAS